jgi:hypothetical protein
MDAWVDWIVFPPKDWNNEKDKLSGIFGGIWVPSILAFSIAIRQRRKDFFESNTNSRWRTH